MTKKIISIVLVSIIICIAIQPVFASGTNMNEVKNQVQPRWLNLASAVMKLGVSSSPIKVGFTLSGNTGTTYSNGTLVLEKISGSHTGVIHTWSNLSSNSYVYYMNDEVYTTLTAGQYRITLTITATNNGVSEVIELTKVSVR